MRPVEYPEVEGELEAFHDDVGLFAKIEPITCWRVVVREAWPMPWQPEASTYEDKDEAIAAVQKFLDQIPATVTPEYEELVERALKKKR